MKNLIKYLFLLGLVPMILFSSCKEDNVEPEDEYSILADYMVQNNLDLSDVLDGWVIAAGGLNVNQTDFSVPDYYVIDLRSEADFNAGHIKDAHYSTMANLLVEADKAGSRTILMVCYTGQTAARATGLLRMLGYNAKALKWGMSGWHADLAGKWQSNAGDMNHTNWVFTGNPAVEGDFEAPVFNTNATDGPAILRARVEAMLGKTTWGISRMDVLDAPQNFFVNNYWPQASWDEFGHVNGAYRIYENLNLANLNKLNPDKEIVTYCYTGQTSAIVTAWLDVLGYNGKSILFGANAIVHNRLVGSDTDSAKKKSWGGEGAGSANNFGYYDNAGNLHGPN